MVLPSYISLIAIENSLEFVLGLYPFTLNVLEEMQRIIAISLLKMWGPSHIWKTYINMNFNNTSTEMVEGYLLHKINKNDGEVTFIYILTS